MNLQKAAEKNLAKAPSMEHEQSIGNFEYFSGSISTLNELQRPHRENLYYRAYIKSPVWDVRRDLYIEHYKGVCQLCGRQRKPLQLHHVNRLAYSHLGVEALDDLLLICKPCHQRQHMEEHQNTYH